MKAMNMSFDGNTQVVPNELKTLEQKSYVTIRLMRKN